VASQTEAYRYFCIRAFEKGEHSFVRNLESTTEEHWDALVPGQPFGRSIGYIAWHTVAGKHLYWDHAFGEKKLTGDYTGQGVTNPRRTRDEVIAYGRKWQAAWLESLGTVTEADLEGPSTAHWGQPLSLRRIIVAVIEHDIYHAGEINHLRALLDGSDRTPGD
jgi:uncharacterized damage-inducible protein DinB